MCVRFTFFIQFPCLLGLKTCCKKREVKYGVEKFDK